MRTAKTQILAALTASLALALAAPVAIAQPVFPVIESMDAQTLNVVQIDRPPGSVRDEDADRDTLLPVVDADSSAEADIFLGSSAISRSSLDGRLLGNSWLVRGLDSYDLERVDTGLDEVLVSGGWSFETSFVTADPSRLFLSVQVGLLDSVDYTQVQPALLEGPSGTVLDVQLDDLGPPMTATFVLSLPAGRYTYRSAMAWEMTQSMPGDFGDNTGSNLRWTFVVPAPSAGVVTIAGLLTLARGGRSR